MKKVIFLSSAAAGAFALANPAYAQTPATAVAQAADDTGVDSDAIVVTARRRAEDVSKVPIAVTAFSSAAIEAKGVTNLIEITKLTPGLSISAGGSKTNPFIVLRGQSKAVTGNGSPGVIVYQNEVPLPGVGSLIQTYDMDNIQVLKGPQGTLFGRNSIGGAILTYSKAPTHEFGGYAKAEFAQYNHYMIEGAVNVPIVKDVVSLRVAAQVGHDGSPWKGSVFFPSTLAVNPAPTGAADAFIATPGQLNPGAHMQGEFASRSYRASLLIEPTDWFKNVTVGDYSSIRGAIGQFTDNFYNNGLANDGVGQALYYKTPAQIIATLTPGFGVAGATSFAGIISQLAQCSSRSLNCNIFADQQALQGQAIPQGLTFTNQDPWRAVGKVSGISNTTTIRLGDNLQLKNIFGYRTTDTYSNSTLTGSPVTPIQTSSYTKLKETTDEVQLSGSFLDNDLKYTVGAFFYTEKPLSNGAYQMLEVSALFGLSHTLNSTWLHNNSRAVYGQLDYSLDKVIPGLSVTAGLRQTWDTQSACTTTQLVSPFRLGVTMVTTTADNAPAGYATQAGCQANTNLPAGASAQDFPDAHFKKLTYTFGANWQINPDAMVYVTHRRGYRAGGYNTPLNDPWLAGIQTFKPETLTDWEVGAKAKWRAGGMRGTFEIAAFTGDDKDNQLAVGLSNLNSATGCVPGAQAVAPNPGTAALLCRTDGVAVDANNPATGRIVRFAGTASTASAGSLTIRGIEASGTFSPFQGLTFGGSVGYLDTKVNSLTLDPKLLAFIRANNRIVPTTIVIQGQPKWTTNANVTVEIPGTVLGGKLTGSLDYRYTGSYRSVEIDVPSQHQIDLRLNLSDIGQTGLSVAAWVRNLTDEITYDGTGSSSPSGIGASSYLRGQPRTVGMSLTYKFGH